jgi:predicted RNase H-like nuclease
MLHILGIDLAWGYQNPDGLCCIVVNHNQAQIEYVGVSKGKVQLIEWVKKYTNQGSVLAMVDAPLICLNENGSRPVDRESHRSFGKYKAGCYPVNRHLCRRPLEIVSHLKGIGFGIHWQLPQSDQRHFTACEVYPHVALIRWFNLRERIKYKKGNLYQKNNGFSELKQLLLKAFNDQFFAVDNLKIIQELISQSWSKNNEDQVDALICALMGYWHWKHKGEQTEILGDLDSGFIAVPKPLTLDMA